MKQIVHAAIAAALLVVARPHAAALATDGAAPGVVQHAPAPHQSDTARAQGAAKEGADEKDEPKGLDLFGLPINFDRSIVDIADPRSASHAGPFVISYKHNRESNPPDQFILLGETRIGYLHDLADDRSEILSIAISADADIDLSKSVPKSSLIFGLPISYFSSSPGNALLTSFNLSATPEYITDRSFRRDVYQATISFVPSSTALGAGNWLGSIDPKDPSFIALYWLPSFGAELGKVIDPDGDPSLMQIEKEGPTYQRAVVGGKVMLVPGGLTTALKFQLEYAQRLNISPMWDRGFGEFQTLYSLMDDALQLTVAYRYGRRPPTFGFLEEWVAGIGVKL